MLVLLTPYDFNMALLILCSVNNSINMAQVCTDMLAVQLSLGEQRILVYANGTALFRLAENSSDSMLAVLLSLGLQLTSISSLRSESSRYLSSS